VEPPRAVRRLVRRGRLSKRPALGGQPVERRPGYFHQRGATWTLRESARQWTAVASTADGERLAAGSANGLFLSDDAGESWRHVLVGSTLTSVSNSHDGRILAATASGGRIHVSLDRGSTWAAAGATAEWSSVVSTSDGRNMVGAGSVGNFTSAPAILR